MGWHHTFIGVPNKQTNNTSNCKHIPIYSRRYQSEHSTMSKCSQPTHTDLEPKGQNQQTGKHRKKRNNKQNTQWKTTPRRGS